MKRRLKKLKLSLVPERSFSHFKLATIWLSKWDLIYHTINIHFLIYVFQIRFTLYLLTTIYSYNFFAKIVHEVLYLSHLSAKPTACKNRITRKEIGAFLTVSESSIRPCIST